jgi:hypothetical protein
LNQGKDDIDFAGQCCKLHSRDQNSEFVLRRHSQIQIWIALPIWNDPAIISLFLGVSLGTSLVASVNFDSARYNPTLRVRRASIIAANYGE